MAGDVVPNLDPGPHFAGGPHGTRFSLRPLPANEVRDTQNSDASRRENANRYRLLFDRLKTNN
jgi:hypothetical protein